MLDGVSSLDKEIGLRIHGLLKTELMILSEQQMADCAFRQCLSSRADRRTQIAANLHCEAINFNVQLYIRHPIISRGLRVVLHV